MELKLCTSEGMQRSKQAQAATFTHTAVIGHGCCAYIFQYSSNETLHKSNVSSSVTLIAPCSKGPKVKIRKDLQCVRMLNLMEIQVHC